MNKSLTLNGNIKTILLVEDDVDDQDFIIEALLEIDDQLTIHTVSNGNKALPFLEALPDDQLPQLLILDYNLPELDGPEVLQQLQNPRYEPMVKIVWSTSNAPQYKARCLELGATFYLVKPSTITGIAAMASQMLQVCESTA